MITEDYVSFETAKLLKEKGFPQSKDIAMAMYNEEGTLLNLCTNTEEYYIFEDFDEHDCVAVSQAMAMKWLREAHKLHIEIYRTACGYQYIVSNIPYGTDLYASQYEGDDEDSGQFTTNEKAVEAALKHCLTKIL